jgi:hypothetical protein
MYEKAAMMHRRQYAVLMAVSIAAAISMSLNIQTIFVQEGEEKDKGTSTLHANG